MTLRKGIAALALTIALIGFTSRADAQVTVTPGVGGVTVGGQSSGAGVYIPYGGGGAQFYHPSMGAWNYSNGTISPAYSSFYTPYSNYGNTNFGYGTYADNGYYNPYSNFGGRYVTGYTPDGNWGNTYGNYSSFYTLYGNTMSGWTYPTTTYYPSSTYSVPSWGSTYYVSPGRGRGMFRR